MKVVPFIYNHTFFHCCIFFHFLHFLFERIMITKIHILFNRNKSFVHNEINQIQIKVFGYWNLNVWDY